MKKKLLIVLCASLSILGFSGISISATYNGHFYVIVPYAGKSWNEATTHMHNFLGPQYYLATITSEGEQQFIESILPGAGQFWLGGFQQPINEPIAGKNWYWVNSEGLFWDNGPVGAYANWQPGEPNDSHGSGVEQHLAMWANYQWRWNDEEIDLITGYVAEAPVNENCGFVDVPPGYWAEDAICKIYDEGITTGCSKTPLKYCPQDDVTRAQMAIFLLRSKLGSSYKPPPATGEIFTDVSVGDFAADWIEDLFNRGITTGCQKSPLKYCPTSPVTRAQMAIFLLRSKYDSNYKPPPATGIFDDVPVTHWAAAWIEQLYKEGITTGCKKNPLMYCPESEATRAQMAVFIVKTFGL